MQGITFFSTILLNKVYYTSNKSNILTMRNITRNYNLSLEKAFQKNNPDDVIVILSEHLPGSSDYKLNCFKRCGHLGGTGVVIQLHYDKSRIQWKLIYQHLAYKFMKICFISICESLNSNYEGRSFCWSATSRRSWTSSHASSTYIFPLLGATYMTLFWTSRSFSSTYLHLITEQ